MLYEYDDFMASIGTLVDLGCGTGADLEWWATRTTRDDTPQPLNIQCMGIDLLTPLGLSDRLPNIKFNTQDFEKPLAWLDQDKKYDVLWCHDAFQYCINPVATLANWWEAAADDAMLCITIPQTTNIYRGHQHFTQASNVYHHFTIVSLIHMLAVSGWDCNSGFFLKEANDTWLNAVVYKSTKGPQDPKTTSWYDLADLDLLPNSARVCVDRYGEVRQNELTLIWLNKALTYMGHQ
jgi:SAM-dependent methyltransferase